MATLTNEITRTSRRRPLPLRFWAARSLQYAVLIALALIIVGPILTAVLGGLKTTGELFNEPFGLPTVPRWENYIGILSSPIFWRQLLNSAIIVIGTVSLTVTSSALLAFVFSRLVFTGREVIFNFFTLGLLFPVTIAFLPVFIQVRQLGLIDSYFGVILPLVAFGIPGSTLILRGFFRAIPSELEDAAYIDGCGTLGFFWFVLLPLARPALGAIIVLQTIVSWNEYFLPLLVLTDDSKWPLTLGIMQFQGQYGTDWGRVMAFVSLLIVPAVLFYIFTQRYIVTGLTGGELKG
ncbi:MAG: carbohydrate ABC transporter permease [Anaerolineae bacterium]